MLGGRYIQYGERTDMFGELRGRSSDVAEGLDCALEGYEKLKDVEVPSGEGHIPVYVRSISGRPETRMDLCER